MPNGDIIEAIAIRSKVYALKIKKKEEDEVEENYEEMKRLKGVRQPIVAERLRTDDYRKALYDKPLYVSFQKIASKKHVVTTNICRKKALTAFDDKR